MKTELTIEESTKLIELGVDPEWAKPFVKRGSIPIITLEHILELLPKEILIENRLEPISIYWNIRRKGWSAYYPFANAPKIVKPELIDSLYQLLIWTIENKVYGRR